MLLASGAWADARPVFVYDGNGAQTFGYSKFGTATGRPVDASATLPSDLSGNACVILNVNATAFDAGQKAKFTSYVQGGGTLIATGEHSGFAAADDNMNAVATALGAHMSLVKDQLDTGFNTTTNVDADPLTNGVHSIRFAAASSLNIATPARSLVRTTNASGAKSYIGAEKIGPGLFILLGDVNTLSDNSNSGYSAQDNGRLASNICGGGSGTGGKTTSGGALKRPTATRVVCNYIVATFSDTCTATVGDTGAPTRQTPTGQVRFGSASGGVFIAGNTCQLAQTPLSPGVASCSVQWLPPANAGFPKITAEYLGSSVHSTSNAITSFLLLGSLGNIMNPPTIFPFDFIPAPNGPVLAKKPTYGARVTYTLKAPARVRFVVQRRKAGKLHCPKPKKGKKRKPCSRYKTLKGSFTVTGKTGKNSFRFRGRIGGKTLKPGRYRLVATPFIGNAKGKVRTVAFGIKRP